MGSDVTRPQLKSALLTAPGEVRDDMRIDWRRMGWQALRSRGAAPVLRT